MRDEKKKRLEAAGWTLGDAGDFLRLPTGEREFIELKLALASLLRTVRREKGWTQTDVAQRLGSSQSRVAKMEAGDPTVTIDLLLKSLLALGVTRAQIAKAIAAKAA